jgi:hypothetical protein
VTAVWWAKVQSGGPLAVEPDSPAVPGLVRAPEPDGSVVWLLPELPDGAGHGVLEELGTPPVAVEYPNETARVLAIAVQLCWRDRGASPWPGAASTVANVRGLFAALRGRAEQPNDQTLVVGAIRRLHAAGWLIVDERAGTVRLGPRVAGWSAAQLATLREVCRLLPEATG